MIALLLLVAGIAAAPAAHAHAYLTESQPPNSSLVTTSPAQVTMRFSEPLEPSVSRADLYDQTGAAVGGTSFTIPEPFTMVLSVPPDLSSGTYAVVWTSLSTADGHTASGFTSLTVGTESDIATVVLPPLASVSAPPEILTILARGITYLGLAILVGLWPVWLLVIRPALTPVWQRGPAAVGRARNLIAVGLGLALGGSVMALILQAVTTGEPLLEGLTTTLFETRYGTLWWIRIGLLGALGALLSGIAPWWFPRRQRVVAGGLLTLAAAATVPFSLISHAAAQPDGQAAAVANDVAHAVAASLWLGGVIALVAVLLPALRTLSAAGRQVVLMRAIPRFSTVALSAWAVLALTGFYSAWLQVGNLTALVDTSYGTSLILKLAVIVAVIAIAAFNLLVLTRRLRSVSTPDDANRWSGIFRYLLVAELVLGAVVLGVTGRLTGSEPARDVLAQRSGQIVMPVALGDRAGSLGLAPGASGLNHFQFQLDGEQLASGARVILRVGLPSSTTERQDIDLVRIAANTYEWHGSEVALPGDWSMEVIVREPGASDLTQQFAVPIGTAPPDVGEPAAPPRFTSVGISALILIVAGITGMVIAIRMSRSPSRRETAGLSAVGLAVGVVMLFQGQIDPALSVIPATNPVVADAQSIALGENLWATSCLSCHGPEARGDGPAAAGLAMPPPDLTAAHQQFHTDQELFYSIANGIAGTGMPAFAGQFSDTDIWNLINYLHVLQGQGTVAGGASEVVPAADTAGTGPDPAATDGPATSCVVGPAGNPAVAPGETGPVVMSPAPAPIDEAVDCDVAVRPVGTGPASVPAEWAGLPVDGSSGATPSAGVPPGSGDGARSRPASRRAPGRALSPTRTIRPGQTRSHCSRARPGPDVRAGTPAPRLAVPERATPC